MDRKLIFKKLRYKHPEGGQTKKHTGYSAWHSLSKQHTLQDVVEGIEHMLVPFWYAWHGGLLFPVMVNPYHDSSYFLYGFTNYLCLKEVRKNDFRQRNNKQKVSMKTPN